MSHLWYWYSFCSYVFNKKIKKLNLRNKKYNKKKIFFTTLLLSGSKQITLLNKKFRKKNKSTDVLSFPFQSKKKFKKKFKKGRSFI